MKKWAVFVLGGLSLGWAAPMQGSDAVEERVDLVPRDACAPPVQQYTGYLPVSQDAEYFYWLFESYHDAQNAPLTIWLNGGPGCSSMIGLWTELGPCTIAEDGSVKLNPYSWNQHSNLLFIDQPAGVGFSTGSDHVATTDEGSQPFYRFLLEFYAKYPEYVGRPLHIFGESYGGHYIPAYASYILDQNELIRAGQSDYPRINLGSIGIGNGWTDPLIQIQYYPKMACNSTYGSVLPERACQRMEKNMDGCLERVRTCYETGDNNKCSMADVFCNSHVTSLFSYSHRSYYDVRTDREPPDFYQRFLRKQEIRAAVGARTEFTDCSDQVYFRFANTGDNSRNFAPFVGKLLDNNVPVLLYSGDADFICNWYGNYAWAELLSFSGQDAYRADGMSSWHVNGVEKGQVKTGGGLTFLRIYGAGHEVPFYQPEASLKMFNDFIMNKPLKNV
ncbi:carboxypeptidase S1 [Gongronella butleri]|nr:carboxypeptidase S1 [Gongronella butleri]